MADVFLSYSSHDRSEARRIAALLQDHGWSVWWDRGIEAGTPWADELEQALARTRAVVVIWSSRSKRSKWVKHEAAIGSEKGALISVLIDNTRVPAEFASYQAADLSNWNGDLHRTEVEALLSGLARVVTPSRLDDVRPGYDPDFLGKDSRVPLPAVTGAAVVLRYLHFTVVMHPGRRLAHYVAYNIDGKNLVPVPPEARQWATDPLIPTSLQINVALTTHSQFHRGHLVSPVTVCWGNRDEATVAGRQASFFPNVSPQHGSVNVGSWLRLEQHERETASRFGRAVGFSGPIFSRDDEPFRGEMHLEDGVLAVDTFRMPRYFWKVVVVSAVGGGLACAAYLVANSEVAVPAPKAAASSTSQIALSDVEEMGGLKFASALHGAVVLDDLKAPKGRG